MATPLDTTLLEHFGSIFPFLFVFVLIYAMLEKSKLFSSNRVLYAFLAFVVAIMTQLSTIVRETINTAAPWFILLVFFIFVILLSFTAFGASEGDIIGVLKSKEHSYLNAWIIALILIIVFGSLTSVVSRHGGVGKELDTSSPEYQAAVQNGSAIPASDQESEFWTTIVHPRVLGMILILLISVFTIARITKEPI
jgi:hypothetical protein